MDSNLGENFAKAKANEGQKTEVRQNEARSSGDRLSKAKEATGISARALGKIIEILHRHSGIDFSRYGLESISRRLQRILPLRDLTDAESLPDYLEKNPWAVAEWVEEITVNVTSMFRDPEAFAACYRSWSQREVPERFRVWIAGCSSGEELWSFCIVWHLLGWTERVEVMAGDLSDRAIERAGSRRIRARQMGEYKRNFQAFLKQIDIDRSGDVDLSDYFEAVSLDEYCFKSDYAPKIDFGFFDLSAPMPESEHYDFISCRNVLIYFDRGLQQSVIEGFDRSMAAGGQILLGSKESLVHYTDNKRYRELAEGSRLFEKIAHH